MERLFRFFFRRAEPPPKQEVAEPAKSPEPPAEPEPLPVPPSASPTPVPINKDIPPRPASTNKSKEVVPSRGKENPRSRETVDRRRVGSKEKRTKSSTEVANRSKEQRGSKESPIKRPSKDKPNNKRSRTSSAEKITRKGVSTPERAKPPLLPPTTHRTAEMSSEKTNEKTTDVDPNTLASENEKRTTMTEKSEAEKRQTGVKKAAPSKERTSMRRRMKDAAMASSRQIRRASTTLTDSAKKFTNFVSRPIKERSMNKFMERVQQRKEQRLKQTSESMQLRESEDAFPTMPGAVCADKLVDPPGIPSERSEKSGKSEKSEKEKRKIGSKEADKIFPDLGKEKKKKKTRSTTESKASKRSFVSGRRRKRKDNEIFVNGRPFWVRAGKITQEERNEITQDDLPLNAEVIVDVKNGKIELPVLPNIPFKFDEYAPMEKLRERDKILFTHKMLFANTIRSMINTAEPESKTDTDTTNTDNPEGEKTVEKKTECDEGSKRRVELLPHPKYCTSYNRALPSGKMNREPYEWTGKGVV